MSRPNFLFVPKEIKSDEKCQEYIEKENMKFWDKSWVYPKKEDHFLIDFDTWCDFIKKRPDYWHNYFIPIVYDSIAKSLEKFEGVLNSSENRGEIVDNIFTSISKKSLYRKTVNRNFIADVMMVDYFKNQYDAEFVCRKTDVYETAVFENKNKLFFYTVCPFKRRMKRNEYDDTKYYIIRVYSIEKKFFEMIEKQNKMFCHFYQTPTTVVNNWSEYVIEQK